VLRSAQAAKDAGVTVYTISVGLPADIDAGLLTTAATSARHYYFTPDPEALAGIYEQIAYTFGCPKDRHDWGKPGPPAPAVHGTALRGPAERSSARP
jgi:hypothetical protein